MKMQLLPFNKAYEAAKTFEPNVCEERSIYGDFLKFDFHYELDVTKIRPVIVRLISYKGDIFYYKMFDDTGEVIECEKIGKTDES